MDINFIPHPLQGTPYGEALDLAIVFAIACWLLSVITRKYSWVDRIWSICPAIYCLIVAADSDFSSTRLNVMTLLVVAWSVRLTFNFARRGGYRADGEDYRWQAVQERLGPVKFQFLNIAFVAPGQMFVIWLFTSPVHQAWSGHNQTLNYVDIIAIILFVVFLAVDPDYSWDMLIRAFNPAFSCGRSPVSLEPLSIRLNRLENRTIESAINRIPARGTVIRRQVDFPMRNSHRFGPFHGPDASSVHYPGAQDTRASLCHNRFQSVAP